MIQKKKTITASILTLFLFVLPLFISKDYILSILCMLFLYITLSQSWNILGGYTGQVNVGQAAFFGIGALVARLLWIAGMPFYLAIVAGGLGSVLLSVIIGLPALRLKGHYFAIGTLAVAWIAQITVGNMLPGISFLPAQYMATYGLVSRYYVFLIVMVGALATIYFTVHSRIGLGMEATRDDEEAAQTVGVNIFKYKVIAFMLSSFFAGLAGGGFAYFHASFYWHLPFGLMWCFEPILIAFIGGVGSFIGPIVGSVCYVLLKEIFALTLGEMNVLIFGIVFILTILFFPKGIIGLPSKIRELFRKGREPLLATEVAEDKSKSQGGGSL
jgi:branched-chain amino acid transport system permease protein